MLVVLFLAIAIDHQLEHVAAVFGRRNACCAGGIPLQQVLTEGDGLVLARVDMRMGIDLGAEIIGFKGIYIAHDQGRVDEGERPGRVGPIDQHGGLGGVQRIRRLRNIG